MGNQKFVIVEDIFCFGNEDIHVTKLLFLVVLNLNVEVININNNRRM